MQPSVFPSSRLNKSVTRETTDVAHSQFCHFFFHPRLIYYRARHRPAACKSHQRENRLLQASLGFVFPSGSTLICQYGRCLHGSEDLRSAMCPASIPPKTLAPISHQEKNKATLPLRLDRLILYLRLEEQSQRLDLLALSFWRTISPSPSPVTPLHLVLLFPPLKGLLTCPPRPPSRSHFYPLTPSPPLRLDRLSDSKSETLIQRSAQVSWILLKSHFHFTSSLLAPPLHTHVHLPTPTGKHHHHHRHLLPSWPHPYTSAVLWNVGSSSVVSAYFLFPCQYLLLTHKFLTR